MRLRDFMDPLTWERYKCEHEGYHCSQLILPTFYAITRGIPHPTDEGVIIPEFIRWSTPDDPPFPCLCDCDDCEDWRKTMAEIDGEVVFPIE